MRVLPRKVAVAVVVAVATLSGAAMAQTTECDRLAVLTSDPDRVGDGVRPDQIAAHARAAVTACSEALKAAGGTRRFMTALGLANFHLGQFGEAAAWFQQAAALGSSTAMNGIGVLYAHGKSVPEDHEKAVDWFRRSAELGNARAMVNLGIAYAKRSPDRNIARAMDWFRKAAEKGDSEGMFHVGLLYYGAGNFGDDDWKTNDKEALKWLSTAAGMGSAEAMYHLGLMHLYGHGVRKNDARAAIWFRKAVDAGSEGAKIWLDTVCELNGRLSPCEKVD